MYFKLQNIKTNQNFLNGPFIHRLLTSGRGQEVRCEGGREESPLLPARGSPRNSVRHTCRQIPTQLGHTCAMGRVTQGRASSMWLWAAGGHSGRNSWLSRAPRPREVGVPLLGEAGSSVTVSGNSICEARRRELNLGVALEECAEWPSPGQL